VGSVLSYLVVILEHVRLEQPLRLDIVRETREEVMEVLVFSFCPHVIQSLLDSIWVPGFTQGTAFRENRESVDE
jgi:hypothetical protein